MKIIFCVAFDCIQFFAFPFNSIALLITRELTQRNQIVGAEEYNHSRNQFVRSVRTPCDTSKCYWHLKKKNKKTEKKKLKKIERRKNLIRRPKMVNNEHMKWSIRDRNKATCVDNSFYRVQNTQFQWLPQRNRSLFFSLSFCWNFFLCSQQSSKQSIPFRIVYTLA